MNAVLAELQLIKVQARTPVSGPINLTEMAFEMARYARRNRQRGVLPPVNGFDAADSREIDPPPDRVDLHGYSVASS